MNSVEINGVLAYCFSTRSELIDYALSEKKSLIALNAEKILHANGETREFINANIAFSDGIGAVWALRKKGFRNAVKIPGCELWLDIIESARSDKTFYLVGAQQEVIEKTVATLQSEFPGIRIVNYRNGYLRNGLEYQDLINDIVLRKPDVVFVAMGSPRQEELIAQMQEAHTAVYMGLGGSFDVYAGAVKRAPDWWVRNNLEWAYRLMKQPSRITRQIHLVKFAWMLMTGRY
ncbi:MAG TPA: WecB/TagA/CpsF family glycosyltransferase [Bacteroidales bacterium]|jgi:UDP-N-acetyl-D-mannosaminouronate:lipid I N-acetyl-D-mannosaminouronosyltransferase|nr:WecB/TagA/CpsF family glycosyltransferase [Bacteroidales bacterium]